MVSGVNQSGYFDDGTKIGLGGTAHASLRHTNNPLILPAWNRTSVTIMQAGGNLNQITVNGTVERYNQGDGEWYLYQKLLSFSASGKGDLYLGGPTWIKYPNCLWVSGEGNVVCGEYDGSNAAYVIYRHEFIQSAGEKTEDLSRFQTGSAMTIDFSTWSSGMPTYYTEYNEDPQDIEAWRAGMPFTPIAEQGTAFTLPSEPSEYAARTNARTYTFDGVALGIASGQGLTIRCSREPQINRVGRCYGVDIKDRAQKRSMQIEVPVQIDPASYPTRWQAEEWVHEQLNNWGDAPADLVGCGNTFSNCHMREGAFAGDRMFDHFNPDNVRFQFEVPLS